ncbi:MAG: hypothetical protein OEZ39_18280 [Gammaproteobacteria bacterium]|nr:hypothetical protein [Gammaproteobacteria bacterium]MDH5653815.1 hypothetical protein [Gammaproteobacteria bacterium]
MKNRDANLYRLEMIAGALGDLLPHVTFVGGGTTVLLVDEAAHFGVRATDDVDVIVDVATLVEYHRFSDRLRELGFREDADGPICRWIFTVDSTRLKLDVMPVDEKILGFSNRWYNAAIKSAQSINLPGGKAIRVVTPPYFLATKFEAFAGRGAGNYFSHDLEDIVFILENRSGILDELAACPAELKNYFAQQAGLLLCDDFLNVLPGLLNDAAAAGLVERILRTMFGLDSNA